MDVLRTASAAASLAPDLAKVKKIEDAARQFESLLIGQMLKSARGSGEGWLGGGEDGAGGIATEYAEQQLAITMASQGGLGLASMIVTGLERESGTPAPDPAATR